MTTVQFPRKPDDELFEFIAEEARVCGGGAYRFWEGLCDRFGLQPAAEPVAWEVSGNGVKPGVFTQKPQWAVEDPAYTVRELGYVEQRAPLARGDERAARWVENRMQDYVHAHGSYDPDTGYTELSTAGEEYVEELQNIAEGLRALDPTAPVPLKYDDTLLPFLALMRNELHANSHKGDREGWLRMTLEQALDEIRHHADKLIGPVMGRDRDRIREHAADVANCAMMLADIAGVLTDGKA